MDRPDGYGTAVVRPRDRALSAQIDAGLRAYAQNVRPLPGIDAAPVRQVLLEQLAESVHRVQYVRRIAARNITPLRADPSSHLFDPIKAAILHQRAGDTDEAFWLVFLFVHFGKNLRDGYQLARDIFGHLHDGPTWTWTRTSSSPQAFRQWLSDQQNRLKTDGIQRRFGNHRKYETLDAWSDAGTGRVVETYIAWVQAFGSHQAVIHNALQATANDSRRAFDHLYRSMKAVARFGRTARFDYLTMLGKLNLAAIEPPSTYMTGSTGPLAGARLLFTGDSEGPLNATELNELLTRLGNDIGVGMQELEDAICNWQKSPAQFVRFRG